MREEIGEAEGDGGDDANVLIKVLVPETGKQRCSLSDTNWFTQYSFRFSF
jgi:hypothetical protein